MRKFLTLDEQINSLETEVSNLLNQIEYSRSRRPLEVTSLCNKLTTLNASLNNLKKQKNDNESIKDRLDDITNMDLPLDWENAFGNDERTNGVRVDSSADGLILSLNDLGCVDIEYIAQVTGKDLKSVIMDLKGSIYQNPLKWDECFYKGYETQEEYLSGNILVKLKQAEDANNTYDGYFKENVEALKRVLPREARVSDIYVTIGSPFIPSYVIDDFIVALLGRNKISYFNSYLDDSDDSKIIHNEKTGKWIIPKKLKANYRNNLLSYNVYGIKEMTAIEIIEHLLNMTPIEVRKKVDDPYNKKGYRYEIDTDKTLIANERKDRIIKHFQEWVWKDERRKKDIVEAYQYNYGCVRTRHYNGDFLTFPNINKEVNLREYQRSAIARIIFSKNTLLAHDVGTGKTYVMVSAGMELKRMGLSKKNMYVVPNNIVSQWAEAFSYLYPNSSVFTITPSIFTPKERQTTLEIIRDNDFDAIIIPYSCFKMIPIEYECKIKEDDEADGTFKRGKKNEVVKEPIKGIKFEDLGITRLFVDEAHNFKNLPFYVVNSSAQCLDMLNKVRYVQKENNGGGVVFATGTPITNSIADCYTMQYYLQNGEMSLIDIKSFSNWIAMFAEVKTEFEIGVDTSSYVLRSRYSKFHNLTELTTLLSLIADFHSSEVSDGIPVCKGRTDVVVPKNDDLKEYLIKISKRADNIKNHVVKAKEDNYLKITTDGRKAALDVRLVDDKAIFRYDSKVNVCSDKVIEIYLKYNKEKLAQLIFCDTSTPKHGFNIYDELKLLLISKGMKESEIAFVHDATTDKELSKLFEKVRKGEVRVLIGSTPKLGIGVNVQDKLIALHHIDVPWRPSDMTQREGRLIRYGNLNKEVFIYRYITEGSFDAYSWQILETKQNFIVNLLKGSLVEHTSSDIESTVLDYAEVKALAIGNPLIKQRVELNNELSRTLLLQKKLVSDRQDLSQQALELPGKIVKAGEAYEKAIQDLDEYKKWSELNKVDNVSESSSRKALREGLVIKLREYVLEKEEKVYGTYRNFDIILPSNLTSSHPYIYLKRNGKYRIELGADSVGNFVRIDNFIDKFDQKVEEYKQNLESLRQKLCDINDTLNNKVDYQSKIDDLVKQIKVIDEKIGYEEK